jgi:hypothetical protein
MNDIDRAFVKRVMRITGATEEELVLAGIRVEVERVMEKLVAEGKAVRFIDSNGETAYRQVDA